MKKLCQDDIEEIFRRFQKQNPHPVSELNYTNPFTLLVAVVLSAQATDKSVNIATEPLFKKVDTPEKMVKLGEEKLTGYIKSIGLYRNKAKNIIGLSKKLISDFDSTVPGTREELMTLPGVGRKTANVVLNVIFHQPTMPVDTHLSRVAPKIGLVEIPASGGDENTSEKKLTPEYIEEELLKIIPKKYLYDAHHHLLLHGRYVCTAKNPKCAECIINDICLSAKT